eukprot:TRINITY_DN1847_c0_g1_i1.p2 TRINITY_DN1847_c0_g1~~TRINITY_DN1847_c0_g1_i1.p2  ORF type:complete len:223 (+),score=53.72 TRINITY_DN1847_c0_g1_i1:77-745(+)
MCIRDRVSTQSTWGAKIEKLIRYFNYQIQMVNLRLQKRLASSVLKCGRKRLWLDPNEGNEISLANSRKSIRKLIKDGLIMRRMIHIHSRARARLLAEEKNKGRHVGVGKRRGTLGCRMPSKMLWIRKSRVLRRLLRKYRAAKKLDKKQYHHFYLACKGNQYRNKRVLIEAIHQSKYDKSRNDKLNEQQEARRNKNLEKRMKKSKQKNVQPEKQQKPEAEKQQ